MIEASKSSPSPTLRERFREGAFIIGVAALFLSACSGTPAPEYSDVATDSTSAVVEIARFRDARSLAADAAGRLYVVDAAGSSVVALAQDGTLLDTYGGAGTGDYSLLEPMDVDPTNGLDLFIADMGNGRIQRLSRDGEFIESVDVPAGDPAILRGRELVAGRPMAVAVAPGGALYAVEGERGVVIRWEGDRRLSRIIGLPEDGDGAHVEPVDVAVSSSGFVYVADAARDAILVYDDLGTFRRAISGRGLGGVRAVALASSQAGQRLLVVGRRAIAVHDASGGLVDTVRPAVSDDIVGAAVARGALYVLTPMRLVRVD